MAFLVCHFFTPQKKLKPTKVIRQGELFAVAYSLRTY